VTAIRPDHTVLPVGDAEAEARDLAAVLGTAYEGWFGPFAITRINPTFTVDFIVAAATPEHHVAFRVDDATFNAVHDRLNGAEREFGNDPTDTANRRTDHPLARRGLYWRTPAGHCSRS
jgi:catechol 2,3-dioxygenase-like lactoylglutathione lyase family enzyme